MKKIWMNALDALRPTPATKHAPRHAAQHQPAPHSANDHRMSDRLRPALSTR